VLLLRGLVRAVPGARRRAVPGPDHGLGQGEPGPPRDRRVAVGCLRARGAAQLRLPVPDPDRPGPPLHVLAIAHVVPRLDLTPPSPAALGDALPAPTSTPPAPAPSPPFL